MSGPIDLPFDHHDIRVGFSQRVRLEWLEQTANLVLAGNDKATVNNALQELLRDKVSVGGQAERGTREKIITILLQAWLTVPTELESLRVEGLELLKHVPRRDHLAVHWGMVMAVYPFWVAVATQVGRVPSTNLIRAGMVEEPAKMFALAVCSSYNGPPWFSGWAVKE